AHESVLPPDEYEGPEILQRIAEEMTTPHKAEDAVETEGPEEPIEPENPDSPDATDTKNPKALNNPKDTKDTKALNNPKNPKNSKTLSDPDKSTPVVNETPELYPLGSEGDEDD
ncbi:MAG: hypothetical protein K2K72_06880, partial [Duncaniella sp.]|nr:hypothetical protein [Duncaniella sp.]